VRDFLSEALRPGDVFFDIGAYMGEYALLASKLVEPGGCVYAFEPDPAARHLLQRNVAVNAVSNVRVLPYAVTDREGTAWLDGPAWLDSRRLGSSDSTVTPEGGVVEIRTVTLNRFCEEHKIYPTVVKIDTPGGESRVLAGGIDVLRDARAIVIELNERKLRHEGQDPSAFLLSLFDLDKRVVVLHSRAAEDPRPGTELTRETAVAGHMNLALL
jgi:FkbM family methyltransferase